MSGAEKTYYDNVIATIKDESNSHDYRLKAINKLQQYTSHPELLNKEVNFNFNSLSASSAKFTRLFELLDVIAAREEKVLIFANHLKTIDILLYAIGERYAPPVFSIDGRVDERLKRIDNFSSIKGFSAMILNPTTAGMGLNITSANHVIHYSRQWNPALEEQATARAFRNGQTKDVNAYYLFYADTIEEVIDERLRLKRQLADSVVSVVDSKANELDFFIEHI
jgi:SNF2 family DNA or RNA helicase